MAAMRIGVIGAGNIGKEILTRAKGLGWQVVFILKSDGIYKDLTNKIAKKEDYLRFSKDCDAVFLAIPTVDDGKIAFDYISSLAKQNTPVVTCEKGAFANYYSELEKFMDKIGFSATVGGGTRLLRYLEERIDDEVQEIHAVLNGTLNYIFDEVSRGRSLEEVVGETKKLGYAEPNSPTPLDLINAEAFGDVPMKTAILFNVCNLTKQRTNAKDITFSKLTEKDLDKLIEEANSRRYIVSITKEEKNGGDVIGGFNYKIEDWYINVGFKNIHENPLFLQVIPSGVNNSLLIFDGKFGRNGTYNLSGQGAGAAPTVSSMIRDAQALTTLD